VEGEMGPETGGKKRVIGGVVSLPGDEKQLLSLNQGGG